MNRSMSHCNSIPHSNIFIKIHSLSINEWDVHLHFFYLCSFGWSVISLPLMTSLYFMYNKFSSAQLSHSVMSNSLWPHELQHARPPCPSPTPRVHSNSCLLSQWRHLDISSSVVPFSSCPQPLQASESFPMSMTNLDSILESRDITDKGPSNQSYHFSSSCVWMWQLDHKEGWAPKNWCFWTACWRRLLRVPWTARRSNQSILKETSPE